MTDARDGQSRTIRQFHFTDWPEQGVPKSGEGFIDFIGQVHKTKEQFGQEGPITVHCRLMLFFYYPVMLQNGKKIIKSLLIQGTFKSIFFHLKLLLILNLEGNICSILIFI